MKKLILMSFALVALFSCSEDEIDVYTGSNLVSTYTLTWSENLQKYTENDEQIFIDFVGEPTLMDTMVNCRLILSNTLSTEDRVVKLGYTGEFNRETQTDLPESVTVPAGAVLVDFGVNIKRAADADGDLENVITVTVADDSGYFPGPVIGAIIDISPVPSSWPNHWAYEYNLGEASKVKYRIIYDLFGTFTLTPVNVGFGVLDFSEYVPALKEYVDKYNADPATYDSKYGPAPLRDENGNLIKIG